MTQLDLTTPLGNALRRVVSPGGAFARRSRCVVFPEARADVCGNGVEHAADVFIRLGCGCAFTYCRHALVILYGRVKLSTALCPRHDNNRYAITQAEWL
jgi:hypothetical protein